MLGIIKLANTNSCAGFLLIGLQNHKEKKDHDTANYIMIKAQKMK